jgi:integrase
MTKTLPAIATAAELVLPESTAANQDSLVWWVQEYWDNKVKGGPEGTVTAKKNDLQLFFDFFGAVVRTDQVDFWTPATSRDFKNWLLSKKPNPPRKHASAYAPTSVNRILATLRHFAKFIQTKRSKPFEGGYPLEDLKDISLAPPEWNGLEKIEVMRLQSALDQVTQLSTRANQMPRRDRSVFTLSIATGLRASEVERLDFDQYQDNYLRNVRCKGDHYRDVYIPKGAREDLDTYIENERGTAPGPLYRTKTGGRYVRRYIHAFLSKVAAQANSRLPADEQIHLHAHKLRHTSIKRVHDERGPVAAKKHGGHRSFNQLDRYATQTRKESEEMADELFP